jgi:hypothetical protein
VAPLVRPRRHGSFPSISTCSEKLRNVLIKTINPSTATFRVVGATATVRTRSAATRISSPSSSTPPKVSRSTWYPRRPPAACHALLASTTDQTMPTTRTAAPIASKIRATSASRPVNVMACYQTG